MSTRPEMGDIEPNHGQAQPWRRVLVWLVMTIYLLVLTEGALRKWILPGQQQMLFFIKDPLVLAAYAVATVGGLWPRGHGLFIVALIFAFVGGGLALAQAMLSSSGVFGLLMAGYGWRSYFLYAPLAFLIAEHMRLVDIRRMIALTLWLAMPVAALVLLQYGAGADATINKGLLPGQGFDSMPVYGGIIRPAGLFTASAGQTQFVASAVALVGAGWLWRTRPRPMGLVPLSIATAAVLVCLAVGGSRGAVIASGLIGGALMVGGMMVGNARLALSGVVLPVLLAVLLLAAAPLLFPDATTAFVDRWASAHEIESQYSRFGVVARAFAGFYDFVRLMPQAPLFGWGMGMGGNASVLLDLGAEVPYAETGWARHVIDLGPVFGLLFIGFRVALTAYAGVLALRATRRRQDLLPLLLFAYLWPVLLLEAISGQGTLQAYAWLFLGFTLAASRMQARGEQADDSSRVAAASGPPRRLLSPREDGGRLGDRA